MKSDTVWIMEAWVEIDGARKKMKSKYCEKIVLRGVSQSHIK